jgi:hypothetical protein
MNWLHRSTNRYESGNYTIARVSAEHFDIYIKQPSLFEKLHGVASDIDGAKRICARHKRENGRGAA